MRYALSLILGLVFIASATTANIPASTGGNLFDASQRPGNVRVIKLGNGSSSSTDTIKQGNSAVYGPFNLSIDRTRPAAAGFQVFYYPSFMTSADSIQVYYQVIPGNTIYDTVPKWSGVDSVGSVGYLGTFGNYKSLASVSGQSIVFRVVNINARTCLIAKPIRVVFTNTSSDYVDTKH